MYLSLHKFLSPLQNRFGSLFHRYPFLFLFISAVLGIEVADLEKFFTSPLFLFLPTLSLLLVLIFFSLDFLLLFLVFISFFFYSNFSDIDGGRGNAYFVGTIYNSSFSYYIVSVSWFRDELNSHFERKGGYLKVRKSDVFTDNGVITRGKEERFDIYDRVVVGCKGFSKLKSGWYICRKSFLFKKVERDWFLDLLYRLRQKSEKIFDAGGYGDELKILKATIFGDSDDIDREILMDFSKLGVLHVVAISGSHFAVIAFLGYLVGEIFLIFLSRFFFRAFFIVQPQNFKITFSILFQIFFLFVSGIPVTALRAFMMTFIFSLSIFSGRNFSALNSLFASSFFILLLNPFDIWSLSFLLSFSSVLFLILFTPRVKGKVGQLFWISLIASLGTFPISLTTGIPFSLISPLSNFVFVPTFSLIISFCVVALFLGWIFEPLGFLFIYLSLLVSRFLIFLSQVFSYVSEFFVFSSKINFSAEFAVFLFALFLILLKEKIKRYFKQIAIIIFLIFPPFFHFITSERYDFFGNFIVRKEKRYDGRYELYFIPTRQNINIERILSEVSKMKDVACIYICDLDLEEKIKSENIVLCGKDDSRCQLERIR